MAQQLGVNAKIAWCEESVFGVAETGATAVFEQLNIVTESIRLSRNLITSATLTGSREASKPELGNIDVTGDISMEMQANGMDELFRGLLGKGTTTSGATFTHVLEVGSSLPSYSIEKTFADLATPEYFLYEGCKVSSCSIGIKPEGFQDVSFSIVGAQETVAETTQDNAAGYTTQVKSAFTGFDISLITENGSSVSGKVLTADITIENNLDTSMYAIDITNPGIRASLPEGVVKVSGTLTMLFEDVLAYNRAVLGTESSLQITYNPSDTTDNIDILIPELLFTPQAPVIEGPTGLKVELPFEAYYTDSSEATTIRVTVINDINRAYADA